MRIKILVVDDEESICEILKYNLEKEGYEVDCAYSAEEALAHDIASYSLFILDIMMDRISGFDFAKRLKNNIATENTPIIFCSALDGEDDANRHAVRSCQSSSGNRFPRRNASDQPAVGQ